MRIGIYDPYLDDAGGGEKYMMTIAECLAKEHDVSIFWDKQEDIDEIKERFTLALPNVQRVKNIFSSRIGLFERLNESNKFDAIFYLSDGSLPLVLSKKLYIHFQQPLEHIAARSFIGKFKAGRITKVFYNSLFTKSYNEKRLHDVKDAIIYPPVEMFAKDVKKENIILHVGRFRPNKAKGDFKKQSIMIEEFKKMVDKDLKEWKFVIAASVKKEDESNFEKIKEAAQGYPVEFLINGTKDQLWNIYNKAKIYWHASGYGENLTSHPELAEHFGISTVESMGAGVVPVVIDAGGQKEIVEDEKNGFLWKSLEDLQEKTFLLTKDTDLWQKLSQAAKEKAKQFSKERFCHGVNLLLES